MASGCLSIRGEYILRSFVAISDLMCFISDSEWLRMCSGGAIGGGIIVEEEEGLGAIAANFLVDDGRFAAGTVG